MNELPEKQYEELEEYRKMFKEAQNKEEQWDAKLARFLGTFIAYAGIVLILWACWNYSLVVLWPQIPQITPLQMAGLWYLVSVFMKRD